MTAHFEKIAEEIHSLNWETIDAIPAMGGRERAAIEATYLHKYGKKVSLEGTSEEIIAGIRVVGNA